MGRLCFLPPSIRTFLGCSLHVTQMQGSAWIWWGGGQGEQQGGGGGVEELKGEGSGRTRLYASVSQGQPPQRDLP